MKINLRDSWSVDIATRRDEWEAIIPDLIGQQVYVAFATEIHVDCHAEIGGFTGVDIASLVRETTPHRWQGPMPAIAIADKAMRDGTHDRDWVSISFDGIVAHELAHIVDLGIVPAMCEPVDPAPLRELVAQHPSGWPAHAGPLKWAGHGAKFIRTLCHVRHRAWLRGHWISSDLAFAHRTYGLSPLREYAATLGHELDRLSGQPLLEALAGPAPQQFQNLWATDVVRSLGIALSDPVNPVSERDTHDR